MDKAAEASTTNLFGFLRQNVIMFSRHGEGDAGSKPSSYSYFITNDESMIHIMTVIGPEKALFFVVYPHRGAVGWQIPQWQYECERRWFQEVSDLFPDGIQVPERPMPILPMGRFDEPTNKNSVNITSQDIGASGRIRRRYLEVIFPKYEELMEDPDDDFLRLNFSSDAVKVLIDYIKGFALNLDLLAKSHVVKWAEVMVMSEKCEIPFLTYLALSSIVSTSLCVIEESDVTELQDLLQLVKSPEVGRLEYLAHRVLSNQLRILRLSEYFDGDSD